MNRVVSKFPNSSFIVFYKKLLTTSKNLIYRGNPSLVQRRGGNFFRDFFRDFLTSRGWGLVCLARESRS